MTIPEAVKTVTESLKNSPALIAVLVLDLAVLALVGWMTIAAAELRKEERSDMVRLLDRCLVSQEK